VGIAQKLADNQLAVSRNAQPTLLTHPTEQFLGFFGFGYHA
jgi:hypothetical protein